MAKRSVDVGGWVDRPQPVVAIQGRPSGLVHQIFVRYGKSKDPCRSWRSRISRTAFVTRSRPFGSRAPTALDDSTRATTSSAVLGWL